MLENLMDNILAACEASFNRHQNDDGKRRTGNIKIQQEIDAIVIGAEERSPKDISLNYQGFEKLKIFKRMKYK